jgi:choline dehydrogenase-like flavoprotein
MAFDYIVVGAGSAGAVLANRLSADPGRRVLLIEAGPPDRHPAIHIPAAFSTLFRSRFDWAYETAPQPGLAGRRIFWPRGRTLGGSSSLNAMMWVRGFAADYDGWAEVAGREWSWEALVPFFRRAERTLGAVAPDQGDAGALHIAPLRSPNPHTADFLAAARQAGFAVERANRPEPDGFSQTMVTQRRGARFSVADGYLRPIRRRSNLTVRTGVQVRRVLFDGRRAVAVECSTPDGRTRTASARREIALCAGAINTPQLLLLSGIGGADQLAAQGIPLVADRPAVGQNLQDHLVAGLIVRTSGGTLLDAQRPAEIARYLVRRAGMLTSNVAEAYGFVRSAKDLAHPDIEVLFAPVAYVGQGLEPPPAHGLTVGAILLQPRSRGTVRLASTDPLAAPTIDPAYLSDPADREAMLRGLAICERILRQPALRTQGFLVPDDADAMDEGTRHRTALEGYAHTLYHPVGTARMGADDGSVVDPQLRVRGVTGLRVADASVMPRIIRGHTHAPAVVIGERAAELIGRS